MTFNQIQLAIYRRCNYADTPAADVTSRINQWVNIWHQRILAKPGMEDLRDTTLSFASVASQTQYSLPESVTRIESIFDMTTPITLQQRGLSWVRDHDPQLIASGIPEAYIVINEGGVLRQPVATGVWVVSTSAADTTQVAHIEGIRTGGFRSGDITATLNGVTRVALGTFTDYINLTKAYVSAVGAGVISFFDAAVAGNEIARLSIGQTSQKLTVVQLWPTPTSAITYFVDCKRLLEDLANATDVPALPTEFHWLLIEAATFEEWLRKDDSRADKAMTQLTEGIKELRTWVTNLPDYRPRSGEGSGDRGRLSRLGGQYPAWYS